MLGNSLIAKDSSHGALRLGNILSPNPQKNTNWQQLLACLGGKSALAPLVGSFLPLPPYLPFPPSVPFPPVLLFLRSFPPAGSLGRAGAEQGLAYGALKLESMMKFEKPTKLQNHFGLVRCKLTIAPLAGSPQSIKARGGLQLKH